MNIKRFALAALALLAGMCQAAADSSLTWQTNLNSVALQQGAKTIWQFHFGTNNSKPCFYTVALPDGPDLIWHRPPDHPWHLGLWFSWKYINGVNYWEEDPKTGQLEGCTEWKSPVIETHSDYSSRITVNMMYRPSHGKPVLTEHRIIDISPPNNRGEYWQDWQMTFTALTQDVLLDRTPLANENNGAPWGGYAGLSVRFAKDFQEARAVTDQGEIEYNDGYYRGRAFAMDCSGLVDKREVGIAMFDNPKNPNTPSPWYAINDKTMRYFSPAFLCFHSYTLKAGQSLTLRYRLIVHPGRWDSIRLKSERNNYLTDK